MRRKVEPSDIHFNGRTRYLRRIKSQSLYQMFSGISKAPGILPLLLTVLLLIGTLFTSYAQSIAEMEDGNTNPNTNDTPTAAAVLRIYEDVTITGTIFTNVPDIDYWQISRPSDATGIISMTIVNNLVDINHTIEPEVWLERRSGGYNGTLLSNIQIHSGVNNGSVHNFDLDYSTDVYYVLRLEDLHFRNYSFTIQGFSPASCPSAPTEVTASTLTVATGSLDVASFSGSNASNYVIKINTSDSFTAFTDGFTAPVSEGAAYSGSGEQIVSVGTSTSPNVTVTGLSGGTEYFVKVYGYEECSGYYLFNNGFSNSKITCGAIPGQATNVSTEPVDLTSAKISSFTAPSGTVPDLMSLAYVVKVNETNSFTTPSDAASFPTANTAYGSGEQVVYAGTSVTPNTTITNLTSGSTYYVKVYAAYLCNGTYHYEAVGADATMVTCTNPADGGVTFIQGQHVTNNNITLVYFKDDAKADGTVTYINDANSFTAPTTTTSLPTNDVSWNNSGQQFVGSAAVSGGQFLIANLDVNTQYYTRTYGYTFCNGVYRFNTSTPVDENFTTCNFSDNLASVPVFGSITDNTMELTSFTGLVPTAPATAPTGYIIKMNTTNSFRPQAVRTALPTGDPVYAGGEQVVYAGPSTSPNTIISGLTANTEYFFSIEAYFNNCGGGNIYQQTGYQFSKSNNAALADPTITFSNIAKDFAESNFFLSATSDSPAGISYQIIDQTSSGTTLSGANNSIVTLGDAGTVTIIASQPATGSFNSGMAIATLTINPIAPFIIGDIGYEVNSGTSTIDLNAVVFGNSAGARTYSIVGADLGYTLTGSTLNLNDVAGSILIKVDQAATNNYTAGELFIATAFTNVGNSPKIDLAHNLFDFNLNGGETFTINTATNFQNSESVTYSIQGTDDTGSSIVGNVFTAGTPGTVTLRASSTEFGLTYNATNKDVTVTINGTPQSITFDALADANLGDVPFNLSASASSGLTVSYTSSNTAVATISGNTVTLIGPGMTDITASQSGDLTYSPATDVVQSLTVNSFTLVDQTVSVSPSTPTLCNVDATVSLNSTQVGANYYLRDDTDNAILQGPITGTGSGVSFGSESLNSSKTYNVIGLEPGARFNSMQFDDTDSYVNIPAAFSGNFSTNQITVETWAYIPASDQSDDYTMLAGQSYTSADIQFMVGINNGKISAGFFNFTPFVWTWSDGAVAHPVDQWFHVAATYDQNNIKIYINGVEEASVAATADLPTTSADWYIGRRWDQALNATYVFGGSLAETRIWNVARSEAEIQGAMNTTITSTQSGLVLNYNYTTGSGTTITNIGGDATYNGSMTNMPGDATNWISPLEMTTTPTATVTDIQDQTVNLTQPNSTSADISLAGSESGVEYYLRDDADNSILQGPVAGTGSSVAFATENFSNSTTYNVNAVLAGSSFFNALQFDGVDDYATIPALSSLTGFNVTVETWVLIPSSDDTDVNAAVIAYELYEVGFGNTIPVHISINNGMIFAGAVDPFSGTLSTQTSAYPRDQWFHVAASFDGSQIKFYLDGTEVGNVGGINLFGLSDLTANGWRIGRSWEATLDATKVIGGAVAQTRIWNVVRSATDIANNRNTIITTPQTNLVANYNYTATSGTIIADATGNNDATLVNALGNATNWTQSLILNGSCTRELTNTPTATSKTQITSGDIAFNTPVSLVFDGTAKTYTTTPNAGLSPALPAGDIDLTYEGRNGTTYASSATAPINAGDYTVTATVKAANANYTGSVSVDFTVTPASTTISLNLPGTNPIYSGVGQGIRPTAIDVGGSSTLSLVTEYRQGSNAFSTTLPINAGTYDVRVNLAASETNYSATEGTGSFTIDKASLTATLANGTVAYGTLGQNSYPVTYSGFVNGETESVLAITPGHPTAIFIEQVDGGHYPVGGPYVGGVTWSAGSDIEIMSTNYTITPLPGNLTVTPRPITVTGNNRAITYGDDANAGNTVTFEAYDEAGGSGLASAESATDFTGSVTFDNITDVNAGTYVGAIIPNGGLTNGNYTITYVPGNLTIDPAVLTVNVTANDKTYDGSATATVGSTALVGILGSDNVTIASNPTSFVFADANVGVAKTVTATGTYTLGGTAAGNYTVTQPSLSANIGARDLTVTVTANDKIYDGNITATVGSASLSNVVGIEDVTIAGNPTSFAFADANVGVAKTVTATGTYTLGGTAAGNYTVTQPSLSAKISALDLTVTVTANDKTYDGTTTATVGSAALVGILSSDNVTIAGNPSAFAFDNANVGVAKTVTATGTYTLGGTAAGNYTVTQPALAANINALGLIVNVTADDKTYDGAATATVGSASLVGIIGSDDVTLAGNPTSFAFDNANVGTAKTVSATGTYTLGGTAAGNYTVTQPSLSANINALDLTVTVTANDKNYDGTTTATVGSAALIGILGSDNVTIAGNPTSFAFDNANVGVAKTVTATGTYTLGGTAAGNYTVTQPSLSANISALDLTLNVVANDKTYDGTATATVGSASLSGVIGSEDVSIDASPSAFAFADANVGVAKIVTATGTYTLGGTAAGNYTVTQPSLSANISALDLTVNVTANDKTYDGTATATVGSAALDGILGSDNVTIAGNPSSFAFDNANVGVAKTVTATGTYTLGGTAAGNYSVTQPSMAANINALDLTVNVTANDKTYDGTATATVGSASLSGVIGSEDVSIDASPSAFAFADANVGVAKTVTATGTYTLGGTAAGNYAVTQPSLSANISAQDLTVNVTADDKTYDGTATATVGSAALVGILGSDNVTIAGNPSSFAFDNANVGTAKTVTATGTYTLGGTAAGNYTVTQPSLSANISALDLTVNVTANDKTYDGTTSATVGSAALIGILGSDNVTIAGNPSAFAFDNANVGVAKTVTATGTYTLGGTAAGNYTVTQPSLSANISALDLTVNVTANDKTYDGTTSATVGSAALVGIIGSDNVTIAGDPTSFAFDNANVGTAKTVTATGTYTLGGIAAGNYTVTQPSLSANISALDLTVTVTANDKTYDGNITATVGSATLSGVIGSDDVSIDASPSAFAFVDANVGTGKSVTATGTYTLTGTAAGNYSLTQPASLTADITAITLAITADNKSKVQGTADPVLTYTLTSGSLINGDVLTGDLSRVAGVALGDYAIQQNTLTAGGNYAINFTEGTLTITDLLLQTIAFDPLTAVTYGDASFALNAIGGASGNLVTFTGDNNAVATVTSAGTVTIVGAGMVNITANQPGNATYAAADPVVQTLTVNQAGLTITAENKSKAYASANPALAVVYSGFVNGETNAMLTTQPNVATTALTTSNAGSYPITVSGATAANYAITHVDGTLTVDPVALTIMAENKSGTFGDVSLPTLTATYTGFVNGETEAVLSTPPVLSTTATNTSNAGTYPITVTGAVATNYAITETNGTLTIDKATVNVTANNQSRAYGSANPTLSLTYTGFMGTDNELTLDTQPSGSTTATSTSDVGTYSIVPSGGTDNNYALTYTNGTLTVDPASLMVAVGNQTRAYGSANPSFALTYTGFANGEDANALTTVPTVTTTATLTSGVGTYPITVAGGVSSNYAFTYVNATLTVNPATLTASAIGQSITYGSAIPSSTFKYSGFVNGEDASVLITAPTAVSTATSTSSVGTYPITVSGGVSNNYLFSYVGADLVITPATLTATADNQSRTYGAANPGLTLTYTGFQNGEDASVITTTPTTTTTATTTSGVGTYPITVEGGVASNYTITGVEGTMTITQAALGVAVVDVIRIYGSQNPTFELVYSGFVNDETTSALNTQPTASTIATTTSGVGNYPITASGGEDDNYALTYVNGTLTVTPAELTATADDQTRAYGAANPTLTLSYTGLQNGEDASVVTTPPAVATIADESSTPGTYSIDVVGGVATNYSVIPKPGTLTVTKADQQITFDFLPVKTSNDAAFDLTATSSSALTISYSSSDEAVATVNGSTVTIVGAGSTLITASQVGDDNYNPATNVVQQLVITQANDTRITSTITIDPIADQQIGAAPITLTATTRPVDAPISWEIISGPATIDGNTLTLGDQAGLVQVKGSIKETDAYKGSEDVVEFALLNIDLVTPVIDFILPSEALNTETVTLTATVDAQGATTVSETDVIYTVVSGPGVITNTNELSFTDIGRVIVSASLPSTAETNAISAQSSVEVIALYSISGTIRDENGNAFTEGIVIVGDLNDFTNSQSIDISADGTYNFEQLRSGDYELFVTPLNATYVMTFYGDVSPVIDANATPLGLNITTDLTNIDVTMQLAPQSNVDFLPDDQGGTISFFAQNNQGNGNRFMLGRVENGDPLPNTLVILKTAADEYVAADVTNDLGLIEFMGLPTGDYKLLVDIPGVGVMSADVGVVEGEQLDVTALIDDSGAAFNVDEVLSTIPEELKDIRVYPNPVHDYFEIRSLKRVEQVQIYDLNGRTVQRFGNVGQYDIRELPEGLYMIKITTNVGTTMKRLMKQ